MDILKNYLCSDLIIMIYDLIYQSMYYDVIEELKEKNRRCRLFLINCSCNI